VPIIFLILQNISHMAISNLLTVALVALPLVAGLSFQSPTIKTDLLSAKGLVNLGLNVAFNGYPGPTCNLFNTRYRREWCVCSLFLEKECMLTRDSQERLVQSGKEAVYHCGAVLDQEALQV